MWIAIEAFHHELQVHVFWASRLALNGGTRSGCNRVADGTSQGVVAFKKYVREAQILTNITRFGAEMDSVYFLCAQQRPRTHSGVQVKANRINLEALESLFS